MKKIAGILLSLQYLCFTFSFAQQALIAVNGTYYPNGGVAFVGCVTSLNISVSAYDPNSRAYVPTSFNTQSGSYSGPSGWNISFLPAGDPNKTTLQATTSAQRQAGTFSFAYKAYDGSNAYAQVTVYTTPVAYFTSAPQLLNPYSSATYSVYAATSGNTNWTGYGGIRINGASYYSSLNQSATISTQETGGILEVTATNACGKGPVTSIKIGTPFVQNPMVNYSVGSSAYVDYVAYLGLDTKETATGANWQVTHGSGYINSQGTTCNAYPNNFLRIVGTATNNYGSGGNATFYIFKNGTSPYRSVYPNPTWDQVTLDFENELIPEELLKSISLLDEKGKSWYDLGIKELKAKKYFKQNKSITINLSKIPKGTYFMQISMLNKLYQETIIVE